MESKHAELPVFADTVRDFDVRTLREVDRVVGGLSGSRLVVTGSYAVEMLTRVPLSHDDIDINVFTEDKATDLPQIAIKLESLDSYRPYMQTDSGLGYFVGSRHGSFTPRRLEMQFVEVEEASEFASVFTLKGTDFAVPTVSLPLVDSAGSESIFRVKSLSFLIATWAIRISGAAEKQKRDVRASDVDHFRLLLTRDHDREDVLLAMSRHPQMPKGIPESKVLSDALRKANNTL